MVRAVGVDTSEKCLVFSSPQILVVAFGLPLEQSKKGGVLPTSNGIVVFGHVVMLEVATDSMGSPRDGGRVTLARDPAPRRVCV